LETYGIYSCVFHDVFSLEKLRKKVRRIKAIDLNKLSVTPRYTKNTKPQQQLNLYLLEANLRIFISETRWNYSKLPHFEERLDASNSWNAHQVSD
jgi:hypothetical protein